MVRSPPRLRLAGAAVPPSSPVTLAATSPLRLLVTEAPAPTSATSASESQLSPLDWAIAMEALAATALI